MLISLLLLTHYEKFTKLLTLRFLRGLNVTFALKNVETLVKIIANKQVKLLKIQKHVKNH